MSRPLQAPSDERAHQARDLLDRRYAGLRREGALGWYPPPTISRSLHEWDEFTRRLGLEPGMMMEMGSGAGNLSLYMAGLGWRTVGMDISAEAVGWAQERAREAGLQAEFIVADLGIPIEAEILSRFEGCINLAIDADCLHYMLGGRRATYLENAHKLLADEGMLLVRTVVGQPDPEWWGRLEYSPQDRTCAIAGVAMTYHAEPEEVLGELLSSGFEVRSSEVLAQDDEGTMQYYLLAAARKR